MTEETLPNGLVTYCAYDKAGRLTHEWDNGSKEQWQQYDSRGNLTEIRRRVEGERMQVFTLSYDNMGRITKIKDANGNCTRYVYEGNQANASIVTTPCGNTFRYVYDMAERCMEVSGEQGTTRYAYNDLDYCTAVTNPAGETTRYYFDLLCNLKKTVLPNQTGPQGNNLGTVYEYDTYDKIIKTTDVLGNVFATPRDIDGNIIKEIHPEAYDAVTKDGEGIAYEYDLFHHRTKIRYPDGGVERIKYDAAGNIVKKIMPLQYNAETDDGEGWSYVYDEVNRLVEITNPEGIVQKRYVYDLHGNIVKRMDAIGFLSRDTDGARIGELFTYNCMGWLTESRKPVKQEDGAVWYALTQYGYDAVGNMVKEIRYRDYQTIDSKRGAIHTINYTYDKENRLICVSDCTGAVVKYAYNSIGQRISEHRKINDDTEQVFIYHYDAAGRLAELKQSADEKGCGHKTSSIRYEYDHNGNLTEKQQIGGLLDTPMMP